MKYGRFAINGVSDVGCFSTNTNVFLFFLLSSCPVILQQEKSTAVSKINCEKHVGCNGSFADLTVTSKWLDKK